MTAVKKKNKKALNKGNEKNFSQSDTQLMSDLTISSSDLTNSSSGLTNPPTEALTNSQQPPQEDLTPVATVFKNLGISRDTGYKRMSRLQIKPWKIKNKSFLDPVQIEYMESLHQHCTKGGKIEEYPIPSPSGPVPVEEENKDSNSAIELVNKADSIELVSPVESNKEETAMVEASSTQVERQRPQSNSSASRVLESDLMVAINNAQKRATSILKTEAAATEYLLENPEHLPAEYREQVVVAVDSLNQRLERLDPKEVTQESIEQRIQAMSLGVTG